MELVHTSHHLPVLYTLEVTFQPRHSCQQQGGPLSEGILDTENKIVTCPWHGWKYCLIDGKAPHKGGHSVNSYQIKVVKDKYYVDSIPSDIGREVTQPHEIYSKLDNSVKEYLDRMDKKQ